MMLLIINSWYCEGRSRKMIIGCSRYTCCIRSEKNNCLLPERTTCFNAPEKKGIISKEAATDVRASMKNCPSVFAQLIFDYSLQQLPGSATPLRWYRWRRCASGRTPSSPWAAAAERAVPAVASIACTTASARAQRAVSWATGTRQRLSPATQPLPPGPSPTDSSN